MRELDTTHELEILRYYWNTHCGYNLSDDQIIAKAIHVYLMVLSFDELDECYHPKYIDTVINTFYQCMKDS